MNSKVRMLCAINGEKPDRLPVTVHQLQGYHLDTYMNGIGPLEAFKKVGMDAAIQYFPDLHREFCLPYYRIMHDALHSLGFKITNHTCGGTYGIEEYANDADCSETLAPVNIGGNQEPWEMKAIVGNRIALIGGIDQFNVLTSGPGEKIRKMVHTLFEKVGYDGGYICTCSDHFFDTPVDHLKIMAEAAKECLY